LRHQFGSAVVFTHHLRKLGFIRDMGQRVRGSSDILAYVDSMLGMSKVETAYTLSHLKNRDGDLVKPLSLAVEDTDDNTTVIRVIGEIDEEISKRDQARDLILEALADGDKFREDLAAIAREAGISDRTFAGALKELETARLIVGSFENRKRKYSTFAVLQSLQPVYPLQGLQRCKSHNGELTPEEKDALMERWQDRGQPPVTLGQAQWFNLQALLCSADPFLAGKCRHHAPELRQLLARWSNNHAEPASPKLEVSNEGIEARPGNPKL
jgi:AraC-like DNA-binding protein